MLDKYVSHFQSGTPPAKPFAVAGRAIRGKKPKDFEKLTDDPNRKIVMMFGPDGMHEAIGKTHYGVMLDVACYNAAYLEGKVNDGFQFKMVVFPEGGAVKLATWPNVAELVAEIYPAIASNVRRALPALKTTLWETWNSQAISRGFPVPKSKDRSAFLEVEETGNQDKRFMTYERFLSSARDAFSVRAFLYFTVHLREQFSGDGYTTNATGQQAVMEYICRSPEKISDLGDHRIIDLNVQLPTTATTKGAPTMKNSATVKNGACEIPGWYDESIIANPFYQPNPNLIQQESYRIASARGVRKACSDKVRVCRLHVDEQPGFTWPLTVCDPKSGKVTRYIPSFLKPATEYPKWWTEGPNTLVFYDAPVQMAELATIMGGNLSVNNAWNGTRKSLEYDFRNAAHITTHAFTIDFHPFTARFDMHHYQARPNNRFGLPVGAHPTPFLTNPQIPFPILKPEHVWHPEHNPKGDFRPITTDRKMIDEMWEYVNKLKEVWLWNMHCHRFTFGSSLDPAVMAGAYNHHFMRGWLEAEPLFFPKGLTWRTEFFGVHGPEFEIADDENAQPTFNVLQLFDGFPDQGIAPYDLIVYSGQAKFNCVIRTMQQGAEHAEKSGRNEVIQRMVFLDDTSNAIIGTEEQGAKDLEALKAKGMRVETTNTFNLYDVL